MEAHLSDCKEEGISNRCNGKFQNTMKTETGTFELNKSVSISICPSFNKSDRAFSFEIDLYEDFNIGYPIDLKVNG